MVSTQNTGLVLKAHKASNYAGAAVSKRSTAGYHAFLVVNSVIWEQKTKFVARSRVEGVTELLQLKIILEGFKFKQDALMRLYCDNKSATSIAHKPVQHHQTKDTQIDKFH